MPHTPQAFAAPVGAMASASTRTEDEVFERAAASITPVWHALLLERAIAAELANDTQLSASASSEHESPTHASAPAHTRVGTGTERSRAHSDPGDLFAPRAPAPSLAPQRGLELSGRARTSFEHTHVVSRAARRKSRLKLAALALASALTCWATLELTADHTAEPAPPASSAPSTDGELAPVPAQSAPPRAQQDESRSSPDRANTAEPKTPAEAKPQSATKVTNGAPLKRPLPPARPPAAQLPPKAPARFAKPAASPKRPAVQQGAKAVAPAKPARAQQAPAGPALTRDPMPQNPY